MSVLWFETSVCLSVCLSVYIYPVALWDKCFSNIPRAYYILGYVKTFVLFFPERTSCWNTSSGSTSVLSRCWERRQPIIKVCFMQGSHFPLLPGSSVVRAFSHGTMVRRIDPSWWTHRAISCSSQCFTTGLTKAMVCASLSLGWCI